MSLVRPEIIAIAAPLPREQALRIVDELGTIVGLGAARGRSLDEVAADIAARADLEADGPDAGPWRAYADLWAEWASTT